MYILRDDLVVGVLSGAKMKHIYKNLLGHICDCRDSIQVSCLKYTALLEFDNIVQPST